MWGLHPTYGDRIRLTANTSDQWRLHLPPTRSDQWAMCACCFPNKFGLSPCKMKTVAKVGAHAATTEVPNSVMIANGSEIRSDRGPIARHHCGVRQEVHPGRPPIVQHHSMLNRLQQDLCVIKKRLGTAAPQSSGTASIATLWQHYGMNKRGI